MRDRLKLPMAFDAARLQSDLRALDAETWTDHFVRQNYRGTWSVIPLRAPAGAKHPIRMIYSDPTCTEFVDTPYLACCPAVREVLATFHCRIDAARLMKLSPGSVIHEHRDHDLSAEEGMARIHIPVATNPRVEFYLNDTRVVMREGECWYLRLSDPHRVANLGDADRVHLVIDATVNPWLSDLLARSDPAHSGSVT